MNFVEKRNIDQKLSQLLIDSVKDYAIFMLSPEGNVMTWNQGAAAIKGYEENEIIGKPISLFYMAEDVSKNEPAANLAFALKNGSHESEGWRVRKDGSTFWANVVFTALFDNNGKHIGFAKITRDITANKLLADEKALLHAELESRVKAQTEKIIANELLFRKLIENSYDGITLLDDKFNVIYRSYSAQRINGWANNERAQIILTDLIHPDDRDVLSDLIPRLIGRPRKPVMTTFRSKHRLGYYIWVECLFTNMLADENIRAIVCNFKDITERKKSEQEILRQNNVLREISWIGSHEIRRPVASIMGLANLMNESTDVAEKEQIVEMINVCARDLNSLVHLINDKVNQEL